LATHLTWREAHAWLAGYSDGLVGTRTVAEQWSPEYIAHYERGFENGETRAAINRGIQRGIERFAA
jgi:hypothetical protein